MKCQNIKGAGGGGGGDLKIIQEDFHHMKYQSAGANHVGMQENKT